MADDELGIDLVDEEQAERMFEQRLASGDWWIIVGWHSVVHEIERRYYLGEASDDFEVIVGPPVGEFRKLFEVSPGRIGILPLVFAHKRRMSAEQLGELVEQPAELLERKDVLFPYGEEAD